MYNRNKRKFYRLIIILLILFIPFISIGYSALQTVLNINGKIALNEYETEKLFYRVYYESCNTSYNGLVTDSVGITNIATNVKFAKCDSRRNVIFNDMCWQVIRTTETGGTKLIYNGEAVDGKCETTRGNHKGIIGANNSTQILNSSYLYGSSFTYDTSTNEFTLTDTTTATWSDSTYESLIGKYTCKSSSNTCATLYNVNGYNDNTTAYTSSYTIDNTSYSQIGTGPFNANDRSPAMVGYMFNKVYKIKNELQTNGSLMGNDVSYSNGTYTLLPADGEPELGTTKDATHHYTCNNTTGTCSKVRYYYYGSKYIELDGVENIQAAINAMLNSNDVNRYNSSVKGVIDAWYRENLLNKTSMLEDTVYCDSRNIREYGGWNPNASLSYPSNYLKFKNSRYTDDLSCQNITDQFAMSNTLAKLTYPVALLQQEEWYNINDLSLTAGVDSYWEITPCGFDSDSINGANILNMFLNSNAYVNSGIISGVRPVISLKNDTRILSGSGSQTDPWIIDDVSYPTQIKDLIDNETCTEKYEGEVTDKVGVTKTANHVYFNRCSNKRNIIFNNMCWQMIRTTENGGIKMIYNGEPVNGKCESTRGEHKGIVGSTYAVQELGTEYLYGSTFTYDTSTNTYTLENTFNSTWNDSSYTNILSKFTCLSSSNTCTTMYQVNGYLNNHSAYVSSYSIGDTNYAQIGTGTFNADPKSAASAGYMNNKKYPYTVKDPGTTTYKYGNTFTYANGTYTLSGTTQNISNWSTGYSQLNNTHYTCWNTTGTCNTISYIYYADNEGAIYINLTDGKNSYDALNEMLYADDVNKYNSSIKGIIDAWYKENLTSVTNLLEDTVYCNNRSILYYMGWDPDRSLHSSSDDWLLFKNIVNTADLTCANITDQFAVGNSKAKLNYPVALMQKEEWFNIGINSRFATGNDWWTISPAVYGYINASNYIIDANGDKAYPNVVISNGIRPVITLKNDIEFASGTGTETDPWVVKETYDIIYNTRYLTNSSGSNKNIVNYRKYSTNIVSGTIPNPTNSCNTFAGWYEDENLTTPFNINNHVNEDLEVYAKYSNNTFCFPYSGSEEKFIAYTDSDYKLEAWGAQGGTINSTYIGGYGGYSTGTISYSNKENLYINVGGAGNSSGTNYFISGGYNGGGSGAGGTLTNGANDVRYGTSGGGATHIATKTGLLSALSGDIDKIVIVAGGGSGGYYQPVTSVYGSGTSGGGATGATAVWTNGAGSTHQYYLQATGGSQTEAGIAGNSYENRRVEGNYGSFGQGGNIVSTAATLNGAGGGGGFYGGGAGRFSPGGGGSGYLKSTLTNASMYCYTGCSGANTTVVTTTGAHQTNKANTGNGYAKITVISNDNPITIPMIDTYENTLKNTYLSDTYREKIKTITLSDSIDIPNNAIMTWDISAGHTGKVIASLTINSQDNTMYDLYIQGDGELIANPDSSKLFYFMKGVDSLSNIEVLNTTNVINMSNMFDTLGYNSQVFTLNLGSNFDTSNVTNMSAMFSQTGYSSPVFTLNLGNNFDTSKVTDMSYMFNDAGNNSTLYTLNLGNNFDTSNVTNMLGMFIRNGKSSPVFTLNLGNSFDTSKVTNMKFMFYEVGYANTSFALNLGNLFDTSNVEDMYGMFTQVGYSSTSFTLNLGNDFDTSKVKDMYGMFYNIGYSSTVFTLNLGTKFNTSQVENMSNMFRGAGYSSPSFTLNLGNLFNTSNVTNMRGMFKETGYTSTIMELDLGNSFYTSNVTDMGYMFDSVGRSSTRFTLDLGTHFDTSNVEDMAAMFKEAGYSSPLYTLNLGNSFDTSKVKRMEYMFAEQGYSSPIFTLNLGNNFNTVQVENMQAMFIRTGYANTSFTLSLGNKFNTSNVETTKWMFYYTAYNSTVFTLNLGNLFYTSNVTNMEGMFDNTGYSSSVFTLNLGNHFDTSNVKYLGYMFYFVGYNNPNFTLNLGNQFNLNSAEKADYMFYYIGYNNSTFSLDVSNCEFNNLTSYLHIFAGIKTTQKIYVKNNTQRTWVINNSGNSNLTSSNVLIKT